MKISFNHIVPHPFSDGNFHPDSLWGKEISIQSPNRVLVQAVSGKGKSTFINAIYGIRKDFEGTILLNESSTKDLTFQEWSQIRSEKLSVVFQDLQLIPHLSIAENLALKNNLTHHKSVEEQKEWIEKIGLIDKWNTPVGILSYGQQQRVAIIRALLQPFEVILLDEPFAHLDEENSKICYEIIKNEALKNNATIVLTTLDKTDIDQFDQYLVL